MNAARDDFEIGAATVLYVDDEDIARKYFVRNFGADYGVLTASGADEAISILRAKGRQLGVLVTDYRMPGRDGGDLLRQITREFPYVVRILVTAYADRQVLLDTVNSGEIFRILEKPLDSEEVRNTLRLASELSRKRSVRHQRWMAIDETLGFLAHELNTPLSAIHNFARGVERRVAEVPPAPLLAEIGKAALQMDNNARYCLSLLSTFVESVQRAGSDAGSPVSSAQQLVLSLIDSYPLTPAQRTAIRIDVQEDFKIQAMPNCVLLVLSSILGNALRAVQDRSCPEVSFTILAEGDPQIRIADNGVGIQSEILERLLRDPVTTHADDGGNGWGMIFCNRIMQSFGGSIHIHAAPGSDTVITLTFPAVKIKRSDP